LLSLVKVGLRPISTLFPYTTLFRSDQITRELLQMVVDWEMQYNPKDYIKGNYKLDVRTSTSYLRSSQEQQKLDRLAQEIASGSRSEEHTSELQSRENLVCRLLLEKK